jgi:hypothetical protein
MKKFIEVDETTNCIKQLITINALKASPQEGKIDITDEEIPSELDETNLHEYRYVDGVIRKALDSEIEELDFDIEEYKDCIRTERSKLLSESDWTQGQDTPLSETKRLEWATYRQELRDILEQDMDFKNPTWPEPPQ